MLTRVPDLEVTGEPEFTAGNFIRGINSLAVHVP